MKIEKGCNSCKYIDLPMTAKPCDTCRKLNYNNWKSKFTGPLIEPEKSSNPTLMDEALKFYFKRVIKCSLKEIDELLKCSCEVKVENLNILCEVLKTFIKEDR
jgi:hypothetical protein